MNSITPPQSPRCNSGYDGYSTEEFSHEEVKNIIHNTFSPVSTKAVPFTGVTYKCSLSEGQKYGDIIVNDKVIYRGFFKNELAHGYGSYCFENGMVFEGSFVNGFTQGKGSLTSANQKSLYTGQFYHGSAIGSGRLSLSEGTMYVGEFNHNVQARLPIPQGQGKLTFKDGLAYEGEFKDGMPYEVKQV